MNYHFPSPLGGVVFAVQFVDCESPCASYTVFYNILYIAQFSQGFKRSNFLHKILDPSLDFDALFPLGLFSHVHPGNMENGISVFDVPHPKVLSLSTGAHHWMGFWCFLRLLSCSLSLAPFARVQALDLGFWGTGMQQQHWGTAS